MSQSRHPVVESANAARIAMKAELDRREAFALAVEAEKKLGPNHKATVAAKCLAFDSWMRAEFAHRAVDEIRAMSSIGRADVQRDAAALGTPDFVVKIGG